MTTKKPKTKLNQTKQTNQPTNKKIKKTLKTKNNPKTTKDNNFYEGSGTARVLGKNHRSAPPAISDR